MNSWAIASSKESKTIRFGFEKKQLRSIAWRLMGIMETGLIANQENANAKIKIATQLGKKILQKAPYFQVNFSLFIKNFLKPRRKSIA